MPGGELGSGDTKMKRQRLQSRWRLASLGEVTGFCPQEGLLFSRPVVSDPLGSCSTPGLPVPHHLPEFAQLHVLCIGDATQPSHPLTPSSSALNLSQHQGLFQQIDCSHQMTKILELQYFAPTPVVTTKNNSLCYQMSPVESCFMYIKLFAFYNNSVRQVLLLSVFYG